MVPKEITLLKYMFSSTFLFNDLYNAGLVGDQISSSIGDVHEFLKSVCVGQILNFALKRIEKRTTLLNLISHTNLKQCSCVIDPQKNHFLYVNASKNGLIR